MKKSNNVGHYKTPLRSDNIIDSVIQKQGAEKKNDSFLHIVSESLLLNSYQYKTRITRKKNGSKVENSSKSKTEENISLQ